MGTPDILRDLGCLPLTDRATGFGSSPRDYLPLAILAIAIVLIAAKLVPVTAAFFGAAVLIALLRVLTLGEAYRALDPPILVLLACLIPISDAVNSTGAAGIVAGALSAVAGELSSTGTIALVPVATMAMTPFLNKCRNSPHHGAHCRRRSQNSRP